MVTADVPPAAPDVFYLYAALKPSRTVPLSDSRPARAAAKRDGVWDASVAVCRRHSPADVPVRRQCDRRL